MGQFADHVVTLARRAAAPAQAGVFAGDNPAVYNKSDPLRLWVIQLVVIIGMTQLLALFLSRIRQPRVIAEVIGGVILGPSVMGHIPKFTTTVFPKDSIPNLTLTANIGLVLFLFLVGMEIDTRVIRRNAKASMAVSVAGLVIPLGLGAALAVPIYHQFTDGTTHFGYFVLFVAVAVGITAFPVLCRILTELKLLDTTVGVVVLSAGVGNDVVGWVLLALTVALINASSGLTALWVLLAGAGFVIFICFPLRWAYRWIAKKSGSLDAGSPSAMMMTITVLLVFISAFYTDIIGIHPIFGGFLAGLIIPKDNGYSISLVEKLEDLISILLLPLYFALSGLNTNLGTLNNGITWGYVILICVIAFVSKFVGCAVTAKLTGFNLRESAAIGTLMSCKGLVELIVLNVGLTAGVLDTRTFSMFVVHALVLTFMTTPLTIFFYPPKYRLRVDQVAKPSGHAAQTAEDGNAGSRQEFEELLKSRFSVAVDKIDQLPAVMTLSQLLQRPFASTPSAQSSTTESITNEKVSSDNIPQLSHSRRNSTERTRISIDVLRLIELTNRTSAVFKSQAVDALLRSDPVLTIFRTFGYLNRIAVSTALNIVGQDDFAERVAEHARSTSSQMVILPWTSAPAPADGDAADENDAAASVAANSHYVRQVFAESPVDVALFWDRGGAQTDGAHGQFHVFLPFFGGPDDRAALALVVQLCANPAVSATVVRMKKVGEPLAPMDSIAQAKAEHALHGTVHSTVFPDTVYGALSTQTALASDTADNLLWATLTTDAKLTADAAPEFAPALARIAFTEEHAAKPLRAVVELAARRAPAGVRTVVVAGRSRRMAVESHRAELLELGAERRGATVAAEVSKTLGDVACGFIVAGSSASLLVVQAQGVQGR